MARIRDWLAYQLLMVLPISQRTPRWASAVEMFILPYAGNHAYRNDSLPKTGGR